MKKTPTYSLWFYCLLAFTEGTAVMGTELVGAKMLAPYFGASLYVWSAVMAVTLGGLAAGYFTGGVLAEKKNPGTYLMLALFGGVLFMVALPFLSNFVFYAGTQLSLLPAVIVSAIFMLLPPVFCMGMVSPLIIQCCSAKENSAAKTTGIIYAVSTIGGIVSCFLTGFFLMPKFGLHISLLFYALLLSVFPLIFLFSGYKREKLILLLLVGSLALFWKGKSNKTGNIYSREGLLGRIEVADEEQKDDQGKNVPVRMLLMNNIVQTEVNKITGTSLLPYVSIVENNLPSGWGKKVLLLGLGGGSLANSFCKKGYKVTAVELDERVVEAAREFFQLNKQVKIIVDDARHAVTRLTDKYDVIAMDLFHAEVVPGHVLSRESLEEIKTIMKDSALIVMNTYGYLQGETGLGNRCLIYTLANNKFHVRVCATAEAEMEDYRNMIIFASLHQLVPLQYELREKIDLSDATELSDDKPMLEYYQAEASARWRFAYFRNFIQYRN